VRNPGPSYAVDCGRRRERASNEEKGWYNVRRKSVKEGFLQGKIARITASRSLVKELANEPEKRELSYSLDEWDPVSVIHFGDIPTKVRKTPRLLATDTDQRGHRARRA
jgi:hypothetical protein